MASEPEMTVEPRGEKSNGENGEDAVVSSALEKLRTFVDDLPDAERQVLAALLAPAVAQAFAGSARDADVAGFHMPATVDWMPSALPASLSDQLRARRWQITVDDAI